MRSGLAIEMRIWSKLCGPETCPKMFINSFIEDPFPVGRHARGRGHPGGRLSARGPGPPLSRRRQKKPTRAAATACAALLILFFAGPDQASQAAVLPLDTHATRAQRPCPHT